MDEKTDLTVFMEPEEGPNVLQNDTIFVAHVERRRVRLPFEQQKCRVSGTFCLDSPSVRNTKHFLCDRLMTSDKEVHRYGSIQNWQIYS